MKKTYIFISIILISISALSFYYFRQKNAVTPIQINQVMEDKVVSTSSENIKNTIDTSDWAVYRNERWGFGFKYPIEARISSVSKDQDTIMLDLVNQLFPNNSFHSMFENNEIQISVNGWGYGHSKTLDYWLENDAVHTLEDYYDDINSSSTWKYQLGGEYAIRLFGEDYKTTIEALNPSKKIRIIIWSISNLPLNTKAPKGYVPSEDVEKATPYINAVLDSFFFFNPATTTAVMK